MALQPSCCNAIASKVYTTDPRIEPNARKMKSVSYEEMLEMASLGSKVLQIRKPSRAETLCTIISTSIFASLMGFRILYAIPGSSGTPIKEK
jgi:hypothetical protein